MKLVNSIPADAVDLCLRCPSACCFKDTSRKPVKWVHASDGGSLKITGTGDVYCVKCLYSWMVFDSRWKCNANLHDYQVVPAVNILSLIADVYQHVDEEFAMTLTTVLTVEMNKRRAAAKK